MNATIYMVMTGDDPLRVPLRLLPLGPDRVSGGNARHQPPHTIQTQPSPCNRFPPSLPNLQNILQTAIPERKDNIRNHRYIMPLLSLLIPMKNEAEGLEQLFARLRENLARVTEDYEILCVDDGSTDATYARLCDERAQDNRIKIIRLSRNFGKESALAAALDYAQGEAVIPIDADLQDPPELIPDMVALWQKGHKVVLASRRTRTQDSWGKRVSASWFYRTVNWISSVPIPNNTGDFRLMDKQVVAAIRQLPERTRFSKGIFAWVGFDSVTIPFDRPERNAGNTKWSFRRLWRYALDGIFAFSTLPLHIWTYAGAFIALLALLYAIFVILRTLVIGVDVPGYASLLVAILFLGGIQLISLGIIGEYIGRIYKEVKHRPIYITQDTHGFTDGE